MKKTMFTVIVLAVKLLSPSFSQAQGTLYVSNLGQTPTDSMAIATNSWIAQEFDISISDPNSYTLNSVQLLLDAAAGSPSGFRVSIYSGSTAPQIKLGNLIGSTNPSTGGIFTYTASGITLVPGVSYFLVATASTSLSQGTYNWSADNNYTISGTWNIVDEYYTSTNGSSWTDYFRQDVFQLGIYATPVPEPSTSFLLLLGSGIFFYIRTRNKKLALPRKHCPGSTQGRGCGGYFSTQRARFKCR